MSDNVQVKILSFKQFRIPEKPQNLYFGRGQHILNIIVYSPNKLLKFLDKPLEDANKNDALLIVKCNNQTSLGYAVKNLKVGIKSIVITDKQFNEELVNKIFRNQQDFNNEHKLKFWMYVSVVEEVNHRYFHQQRIEMITCDQTKLIKLLEQNVMKAQSQADQCRSTTTIQSGDEELMKNKISTNYTDQRQVIGTPTLTQQQLLDNGIPGVGTYDLSKTSNNSVNCAWDKVPKKLVFSKQQPTNHIMTNQIQGNQVKQQINNMSKNDDTQMEVILKNNNPGAGDYNIASNESGRKFKFSHEQRKLVFPPQEKASDLKHNKMDSKQ